MTQPIPRRHPAAPRPVPIGIAVVGRMLGISGPDAAEFQRLGELLMVGDPLMDSFVDWMTAEGSKSVRPLFEQALAHGIDSVPDAPAPLHDLFTGLEATPDWVEPERLRIAAATMRSGGADGLYIARDVALLGGYQFAGFNQTLLRTGALEKGSNTRFAETSQWAMDVIAPGGLDKFGPGYRSTIRVRLIHSMVRRHVEAMPDWDDAQWGLPINQTDMAATIVGALVAPSVGGIGLGLINRASEYQAIAHLTRYVGWLIGVRDDLLPTDFHDALRLLMHTSAALATPDETSKRLAQPMADDPLQWRYPHFQELRRRIARSQHLSISAGFLGPSAMATLGLPTRTLPWYHAIAVPRNLVKSGIGVLPGGRRRLAAHGRRDALGFMATMTPAPATIGETTTVAEHVA
ncbi:oxygenase MpaB family protein [Gordonia sp. (in: high G+C Gram-positive bacteria)]|uniref:oxygenase MpaB family protein n=1 Tax=Gordonia sp. (in: high G+C Gram-positive bacteria) TaxID=84139 RepID=UPI00261F925E|nr:oxygenase MpaB family protein [Gordonia sp. (in: high G+C Gram-positive bacteria)]